MRWQAGRSLIALEAEAALDPLAAALQDASPLRRAAAAEALGESRWPEATSLLIDALNDEDPGVRVTVATALGRLRDRISVAHLAARLAYEPSPGVRWALLRALGAIGAPAGADTIRAYLTPEEPTAVRRSAAWALGQIRWHASAIEGLLEALSDPDPQVRGYACRGLHDAIRSLSRIGPAERELLLQVREALEAAYHDQRDAGFGVIGELAAQALAQLESKRL